MERFLPLNLFLLLKTLSVTKYLANFTIMVWRLFFVFAPIRWVWSISFTSRFISTSDLIVWITTSSVTSCIFSLMPCIRRQLFLQYCLCVYLLLYFTIFVSQKRQTLFQTFNLLFFLPLLLVLIKLFRNVFNSTCQIF